MSWKTGVRVADDIWDAVTPYIKEEDKAKVAEAVICVFEKYDCDIPSFGNLGKIAGRDIAER